jgi:hypothetical protein
MGRECGLRSSKMSLLRSSDAGQAVPRRRSSARSGMFVAKDAKTIRSSVGATLFDPVEKISVLVIDLKAI